MEDRKADAVAHLADCKESKYRSRHFGGIHIKEKEQSFYGCFLRSVRVKDRKIHIKISRDIH